jgi:hypothetical protein
MWEPHFNVIGQIKTGLSRLGGADYLLVLLVVPAKCCINGGRKTNNTTNTALIISDWTGWKVELVSEAARKPVISP